MTAHQTDWTEQIDGARSQFDLEDLARNGPGPCGQSDLERVRDDAMRAIAKTPDPKEFGRILETAEPALAAALCCAFLSREEGEYRAYRLRQEHHDQARGLFRLGCVEARGIHLTSFGNAVRRAMLEEGSEQ